MAVALNQLETCHVIGETMSVYHD